MVHSPFLVVFCTLLLPVQPYPLLHFSSCFSLLFVNHLLSYYIVRKGARAITWVWFLIASLILPALPWGMELQGFKSQWWMRAVELGQQTVVPSSSLRRWQHCHRPKKTGQDVVILSALPRQGSYPWLTLQQFRTAGVRDPSDQELWKLEWRGRKPTVAQGLCQCARWPGCRMQAEHLQEHPLTVELHQGLQAEI